MIRYTRDGDAAVVTLDHPPTLNALSEAMAEALDAALDRAEADGVRALMLTGAGRAFSTGGVLAEPLPDDAGLILETHFNPLILRMAALPFPVVTALNGAAVGAGASLALAGDLIVAGRSAFLSFAFAGVGLVPDGGASWLLPRLIGPRRALDMMLLGERIDAQRALDWGLVTRVVEDAALIDEARGLTAKLAAGPTRAYAAIRRQVRASLDLDLAAALAAERDGQAAAGRTADFREGVAAFRAKRPPRFTGA